MYYSGLTVYAPVFAVEHGLIEADALPPAHGVETWGMPDRALPITRGLL